MSIIRRSISTKASVFNYRNYEHGGFFTCKDERAYMHHLREVGYSNIEISKLTGRSVATVYYHLGAQPKTMTKENRVYGQIHRYQRADERKLIAQKVKDAEIKKENTRCQIIDLTAKLKALKEDYKAM